MAGGMVPKPAAVEDYCSDDEKAADAGAQANVAVKRTSHPSDLGKSKENPREPVPTDTFSDSGYSTHTTATMSSADTAQSAQAGATESVKPAKPEAAGRTSPVKKQRPAVVKQQSSRDNPSKVSSAPSRTASTRQRPRRDTKSECNDPNCVCEEPKKPRRPGPTPIETAPNTTYPSHAQPQPSPISPPSPQATRHLGYSYPPAPTAQPGPAPRRATTSAGRPATVYGGAEHDAPWQPYMPWTAAHAGQRGPPPAMYSYPHLAAQPQYPPGTPITPSGGYFPPPSAPPAPFAPPYERPVMQARAATDRDLYNARRPVTMYGAPPVKITYDQSKPKTELPSARYPSNNYSAQQPTSEESSSEEEEVKPERTKRASKVIMGPPPAPKRSASNRRAPEVDPYNMRYPSLPHYDSMGVNYDAEELERRPRPIQAAASRNSSTRRNSSSRPSLASSGAKSYSNSSGSARIIVESNNPSHRRLSYMGHERRAELEAQHKQREQDALYYEHLANAMRPEPGARRRTLDVPVPRYPPNLAAELAELDARRKLDELKHQQQQIETYQRLAGGQQADPFAGLYGQQLQRESPFAPPVQPGPGARLTADALRGRKPDPETKSQTSQRSRSSRLSQTRTTATEATRALKVNIDGVNLEFQDMGNQNIVIRQGGEEGNTQVVVGGGSSRHEKTYSRVGGTTRVSERTRPVRDDGSNRSSRSGKERERERDRDRDRDRERRRRDEGHGG